MSISSPWSLRVIKAVIAPPLLMAWIVAEYLPYHIYLEVVSKAPWAAVLFVGDFVKDMDILPPL
jgi:hypothetical protein